VDTSLVACQVHGLIFNPEEMMWKAKKEEVGRGTEEGLLNPTMDRFLKKYPESKRQIK